MRVSRGLFEQNGALGLVLALAACGSPTSEPPLQSAAGGTSATAAPTASGSASADPAASALAPIEPPKKVHPTADPAAILAKAGPACKKEKDPAVRVFVSPLDPVEGQTVKAMVLPSGSSPIMEEPADGVVVVDTSGAPKNVDAEYRDGPPSSVYASAPAMKAGTYRFIAHKGGEVVACADVKVTSDKPRRPTGSQAVPWEVSRSWDRDMENLYSAWIEKLFDAPVGDSLSVPALHEITKDPSRNFLHDYLGASEDAPPPKGLRLDPDCADLPYTLRAYFSFKLGLPFTYSGCSRGGGGRPPTCQDSKSNLDPMDEAVTNRVRRFETFLRTTLMNTVHSGTGRTLATEDKNDYYAISLSAETLRPGAIYADPYGHILVVAKKIPQAGDGAGLLFAVDGQPDGTVSRKRFWRGNFLFSLDEPSMGSPGFKRFRPVVMRGARAVALGNDSIAKSPSYGDFSLEQTKGDANTFYDKMDDVLSPSPLDPTRALLEAVDALEEQLKARVVSVENGEKHFRTGGGRIDMPNGASIFETTGDWEDFSTPSRDLRILIATDVVSGFPALVARRPERYKMPAGKTKDAVVKGLEELLAKETVKRKVEYIRSDGSKFALTLADVLSRTKELEMAYNPNDCAEVRWGAREGTPEFTTCKRRATTDQRRKMEKVREWFHDRKRPARG